MMSNNLAYIFIKGLIFLSLFCSSIKGFAQNLSTVYYGINSPLRTNTIYDIHIAKNGLLYIATDNGFWSYNGLEFKVHQKKGLNTQDVTNIHEKNDGEIFFQNFKGDVFLLADDSLSVYIRSKQLGFTLKTYAFIGDYEYYWNSNSFVIKLPNNQGFKPINFKGRYTISPLWISNNYFLVRTQKTMNHVYRIDKDTIFFDRTINEPFIFDCKDNYCFLGKSPITNAHSLLIHGDNDTLYDLGKRPEELRPYRIVTADSLKLICCAQGLYIPKYNKLYLPGTFINNHKKDKEGNLWFSTVNKGLCKVSSLDNKVYKTDQKQGKAHFVLKHRNNLIISTRIGRTYCWDNKSKTFQFLFQNTRRGANKNIFFSEELNQYIHSGGILAIFNLPFNLSKKINASVGIYPDHAKNKVFSKKSNVILLYDVALIGLSSKDFILKEHYAFPSYTVNKSFCKIQGSKQGIYPHAFFSFPNASSVHKFKEWVVSIKQDTLIYVHDTQFDSSRYYTIPSYSKRLYVSNNRFWIEFDDRIDEYDAWGKPLNSIKKQDAITQNITDLSINDHFIVISTKTSIAVYDAQTTEQLDKFTNQNGIASVDFDRGWVYDDTLYVNGSSGVSVIPLKTQRQKIAPSLTIKAVYANNQKQLSNSFDYTTDNVKIDFNILSFTAKGTLYWRLKGKSWKELDRPSIDLEALQPGNYTIESYFENDLGSKTRITTYSFKIQSPFWQTWWFFAIINVIVIGIGSLLWQLRLKAKRKEEVRQNEINLLKMQALQTQMNPHFIFNVQAAIQGLWLEDDIETALELQNHFSLLLRQIFQYSGQPSISIDQLIDFLEHYLELEKIRFKDAVIIDWKTDPRLYQDDYFLPPLLVQPILENAFKHGLLHKKGRKKLQILFEMQAPYFYCKIEDNGVGRKPSNHTTRRSSGLKTTQRRLDILQQTAIKERHPFQNIRVTDLKDAEQQALGTRVELWIPFVNFSQQEVE